MRRCCSQVAAENARTDTDDMFLPSVYSAVSTFAEPEIFQVPGSAGRSTLWPLGNFPGTFFSGGGLAATRALTCGINLVIRGASSSSCFLLACRILRILLSRVSRSRSIALYDFALRA